MACSRILGVVCIAVLTRALPASGQVVAECGEVLPPSLTGLAGVVRDSAAGVTIPGARVQAAWVDASGERQSIESESDEQGVYYLCGVPASRSLAIQATFGGSSTRPAAVTVEPGPPAGWDFSIPVRAGEASGAAVSRFTTPGRIVGQVLDRDSGRPVKAASVTIDGGDRQGLTDGSGRYSFGELPPGVYMIAVEHLAFENIEQFVDLPADRTLEMNFQMTVDPIELEPLVVTAIREKRLEIRGFYERKQLGEASGRGVYVTREDIRRANPLRVTHYLGRLSGIRVDCTGSATTNCTIRMTGGSPSLSRRAEWGCVNANVYVDGVRVIRDNQMIQESIDFFVSPTDIAAIEVYRGPAEVPAEYGGSVGGCGAIVIWTGPSTP